jgi:hypothetical protein
MTSTMRQISRNTVTGVHSEGIPSHQSTEACCRLFGWTDGGQIRESGWMDRQASDAWVVVDEKYQAIKWADDAQVVADGTDQVVSWKNGAKIAMDEKGVLVCWTNDVYVDGTRQTEDRCQWLDKVGWPLRSRHVMLDDDWHYDYVDEKGSVVKRDDDKVVRRADGAQVVSFADGSRVVSYEDGSRVVRLPNGAKMTVCVDGARMVTDTDGSHSICLPANYVDRRNKEEKDYAVYKVLITGYGVNMRNVQSGSIVSRALAYIRQKSDNAIYLDRLTEFLCRANSYTVNQTRHRKLSDYSYNTLSKDQLVYLVSNYMIPSREVVGNQDLYAFFSLPKNVVVTGEEKAVEREALYRENASRKLAAQLKKIDPVKRVKRLMRLGSIERERRIYKLVCAHPRVALLVLQHSLVNQLANLEDIVSVYYKAYPRDLMRISGELKRIQRYDLLWKALEYVSDHICVPWHNDLDISLECYDETMPWECCKKLLWHSRQYLLDYSPNQSDCATTLIERRVQRGSAAERKEFYEIIEKFHPKEGKGRTDYYKVLVRPISLLRINNPPEELCDLALIYEPRLIFYMKQTPERIKRCMQVSKLIPLFEDHIDYVVNPGHIWYAYRLQNILKALETNPDVWYFIDLDHLRKQGHGRSLRKAFRLGLIKKKIINETDLY